MTAPVFVKIDKYEEVEETLSQIKAKTEEARQILEKLESVRAEEESDIAAWKQEISTVEGKIAGINSKLRRT